MPLGWLDVEHTSWDKLGICIAFSSHECNECTVVCAKLSVMFWLQRSSSTIEQFCGRKPFELKLPAQVVLCFYIHTYIHMLNFSTESYLGINSFPSLHLLSCCHSEQDCRFYLPSLHTHTQLPLVKGSIQPYSASLSCLAGDESNRYSSNGSTIARGDLPRHHPG